MKIDKDYFRNNLKSCKFPFTGLTISPNGDIILCCVSAKLPLGNINDMDCLTEFYNSDVFNNIRSTMTREMATDIDVCANCIKNNSLIHIVNNQFNDLGEHLEMDIKLREHDIFSPIRYLEFTTSNICNQTCTTCSSKFSTSWNKLERNMNESDKVNYKRHTTKLHKLNSDNLQKIIDVLPALEHVMIKGGEPFADKDNLVILQELIQKNRRCKIDIISNMASMTDSTFDMLRDSPEYVNINMFASIDGISDVYDWIRGTSFNNTIENMERYYEETGRKINIIPTVSLYNFFTIEQIVEYFHDKEYVESILFDNIVNDKDYFLVEQLPDNIIQQHLNQLTPKLNKYHDIMKASNKNLVYKPLLEYRFKDLEHKNHSSAIGWINIINKLRNADIFKMIPELKEYING